MYLANAMDTAAGVGGAVAGFVALLTALALFVEYKRNIRYWLYRKQRKRVVAHFSRTYGALSEGIEARRHDNIHMLVSACCFINDEWPSSAGIGFGVIGESDPTIESDQLEDHKSTVALLETLPTEKKIYYRYLFSAWEILSFEISREALGRGHVTPQWLDAADDWRICLIALQDSLMNHPLSRGPSDAPVVALLERLRRLRAEDLLFNPAKKGDVLYLHLQPGAILGPYLVTSHPKEQELIPSPTSGGIGMIPLLEVSLEDCTGLHKQIRCSGVKCSFAPLELSTPGKRSLAEFHSALDSGILL